jgi:hypothetical protein
MQRVSNDRPFLGSIGQGQNLVDDAVDILSKFLDLKLEVPVPYLLEAGLGVQHMASEFFFFEDDVVSVEVGYSACVEVQLLPLGGQSCGQLGERPRGKELPFGQKVGDFLFLAVAAPIIDSIDDIVSDGLPLLPDRGGSLCDEDLSLFPHPLLLVDDQLFHVLQEASGNGGHRFVVVIVCDDPQPALLRVDHVVPQLDLFPHRSGPTARAAAVDGLLAISKGGLHLDTLPHFKLAFFGNVEVTLNAAHGISLLGGGEVVEGSGDGFRRNLSLEHQIKNNKAGLNTIRLQYKIIVKNEGRRMRAVFVSNEPSGQRQSKDPVSLRSAEHRFSSKSAVETLGEHHSSASNLPFLQVQHPVPLAEGKLGKA